MPKVASYGPLINRSSLKHLSSPELRCCCRRSRNVVPGSDGAVAGFQCGEHKLGLTDRRSRLVLTACHQGYQQTYRCVRLGQTYVSSQALYSHLNRANAVTTQVELPLRSYVAVKREIWYRYCRRSCSAMWTHLAPRWFHGHGTLEPSQLSIAT